MVMPLHQGSRPRTGTAVVSADRHVEYTDALSDLYRLLAECLMYSAAPDIGSTGWIATRQRGFLYGLLSFSLQSDNTQWPCATANALYVARYETTLFYTAHSECSAA